MKRILQVLAVVGLLFTTPSGIYASAMDRDDVKTFVKEMSSSHGFSEAELHAIFENVEFSESVIRAISRPAEALPWYRYRPIFIQSARIESGVRFWQQNREVLSLAESEFGVPAEIIVAIIGVETRYGDVTGSYKVINSLSTLAFDYPTRSTFFRSELEQFLLLTREQGFDPLTLEGSYAGAMGIPQFISSSFRNYAVDFNKDGVIDIWNNIDDAVGSVGNYLMRHGWERKEKIAMPAVVKGDKYKTFINTELKPQNNILELAGHDVSVQPGLRADVPVKLMEFENSDANEYWLGFQNFYVITRYNHSMLYAMAVYQLAEEIKTSYLLTRD